MLTFEQDRQREEFRHEIPQSLLDELDDDEVVVIIFYCPDADLYNHHSTNTQFILEVNSTL